MSLSHVHISCCYEGCFAVITLHPDEERRLRETHERFYCPAGHQQRFSAKRKEDAVAKLEAEIERWKERTSDWRARWEAEHDVRLQLTHSIQVCPLGCGWHGRRRLGWQPGDAETARFLDRVGGDLAEHLLREHNATRAPVALLNPGFSTP